MGRPAASCTLIVAGSQGMQGSGTAGDCCTMPPQPILRTGTVVSVNVNASPQSQTADYLTVTIQPTGTSDVSLQLDADCLFPEASRYAGASGVPRTGTQVYYLHLNQTTVCLGAMYTSQSPSYLPNSSPKNPLRSTGIRIPDIASGGSNAPVTAPSSGTGLVQASGLLISGTTWWEVSSTYNPNADHSGTPAHLNGLRALADASDGLPFNEVSLQSRSVDEPACTGGVTMYGQDYISQNAHGSISSTALGNITSSAGGAIHIEASKSISLQVGESGITITPGGIVLSQNKASAAGLGSTLSIGPVNINMYAAGISARALCQITLKSFGSSLDLGPLQASLTALGVAKCASGWINYASTTTMIGAITTTGVEIGIAEGKGASATSLEVQTLEWSILDASLSALGLQLDLSRGSSWRINQTLPAMEVSNGWLAYVAALSGAIIPAVIGGDIDQLCVKAKASGFIAKGNEAYMLGGYYLPGIFDRMVHGQTGMLGFAKWGQSKMPGLADAGKKLLCVPLPIIVNPDEGHCLTLASGWQESRQSMFGCEADDSLLILGRMTTCFGPLLPLVPIMIAWGMFWPVAAGACAPLAQWASDRKDAMGTWLSSMRGVHKVAPITTDETPNDIAFSEALVAAAIERAELALAEDA